MNKLIKILPVLLLFIAFGCDEEDDRFGGDPTSGWVEFLDASTDIPDTAESVTIPVNVRVPVFEDGITVNYRIQAVQGDFTPYVASETGSIFIDPKVGESTTGSGRDVTLEIPLRNLEAERRFVTVFDIIIDSVEPFSVSVGLDDSSITSHRVTLGCNAITPANLEADFLVGDFVITNEAVFLGAFEDGATVTVTIDPDNPNRRLFTGNLFASFGLDPYNFAIELIDGKLVFADEAFVPLSCDGENGILLNAVMNSATSYDVCDDPSSVTIVYADDRLGSCGGPALASFTLTKV